VPDEWQTGVAFRRTRRIKPYDQRRDAPEAYKQHLRYFRRISATRIQRETGVTEAQYQAVLKSFQQRLPYLAPEHSVPPNATIDSLLAEKKLDGGYARYGKATVYAKDAAFFEKLQRELADIHAAIAVRQLYQLMYGHLPTHISFSLIGHSAAIPNVDGRNLIHVNTRYSVLDPRSLVVTPLCIVLGHEIEHVNVPGAVSRSLRSQSDQGFTTAEEVRAIGGYENGMLRSLGRGERSTHKSYLVSLAADNHHELGFSYLADSGTGCIRPGQSLQGKLIDASRHSVTIELPEGGTARFETRALLAATSGLQKPHRMAYSVRRVESEIAIDDSGYHTGEFGDIPAADHADITPELLPFALLEQQQMRSPTVRAQIAAWQTGARRGDRLTVSMSEHGLLLLRHVKREIDTMQYALLDKMRAGQHPRALGSARKRSEHAMLVVGVLAKICLSESTS